MIKQEIISKLANNEDLTEEELVFLIVEFKGVHSQIIESDEYSETTVVVLEVDPDLYYEVTWCHYYSGENEFQESHRVKKETKTIEVFVRCEN
ncbi:hypothetical protein ABX026_01435 [Snodgrassella alvi]|uniref:hypothetical protein n=1 Tax=Snodgrassella alvi TaxID=1196083 RepID=UPI003460DD9F